LALALAARLLTARPNTPAKRISWSLKFSVIRSSFAKPTPRNQQIYQDIAQLDRESRRLAREYRAGKISRDALVRQKATVEKQLATAKKVNSLAEQQLADTNQVYSETRQQRGPQDQYSRQLESNVVKLKETRQQSSQNVASLQQMYDGMSI
jgi:chromosome segregation ATPase